VTCIVTTKDIKEYETALEMVILSEMNGIAKAHHVSRESTAGIVYREMACLCQGAAVQCPCHSWMWSLQVAHALKLSRAEAGVEVEAEVEVGRLAVVREVGDEAGQRQRLRRQQVLCAVLSVALSLRAGDCSGCNVTVAEPGSTGSVQDSLLKQTSQCISSARLSALLVVCECIF
jgi:hypothetical protein